MAPWTGARSLQGEQVVGNHTETHPALHPEHAAVTAASKLVTALEAADPAFRAGPPFERPANASRVPPTALPLGGDELEDSK